MAVQREGQDIFNAISEHCDTLADTLLELKDAAETEYWRQHKALSETTFSLSTHQIEAMDRLGKLATAIKALNEARAAANAGRCW